MVEAWILRQKVRYSHYLERRTEWQK